MVFRSCYTVYWEERQKKKKEKKLKEDIEMMQNVGQSNDNVFKVNSLEKNAEDPVLYVSENGFDQITFLFLEIATNRIVYWMKIMFSDKNCKVRSN